MLPAIIWIGIFIISLIVLVKGADWLVQSAEKIGLALGMSPFIVGVVIVGIGTSFPELISSFAALIKGATEIVAANAVGSNVANILLVVGLAAVFGGKLVVKKNLIDLDLPLLAISTVLFLGVAYDGSVTRLEAALLMLAYAIHLAYSLYYHDEDDTDDEPIESLPSRFSRRIEALTKPKKKRRKANGKSKKNSVSLGDYTYLVIGIISLAVGAKYLIDSVIALSEIFNIAAGAITIIAVAVGTSLPELLVSAKAALQRKSELALGNIFGSNAFNVLVVVGLPGLFKNLMLDEATLYIGVPAMVLATFIFVISGISRRIHMWEGAMYLVAYILFTGKVFNLF